MEAGTISHRSRNRNHRTFHKSAHHACQCALHSCYGNHAVSLLDGIQSGKKSVHATDSHIIDPIYVGTKILCSLSCLLRNRNICSPGCAYSHFSDMFLFFFNLQNPGDRIINYLGKNAFHQFILMSRRSCSKYFSVFLIKFLINIQKMFIGFSCTVNHFCKTGPFFPSGIQLCVVHLLIAFFFQKVLCMFHRELAVLYFFKNLL